MSNADMKVVGIAAATCVAVIWIDATLTNYGVFGGIRSFALSPS